MRVDLLYFDDCPSWQEGLSNLKTALAQVALQAEIHLVRVENNADAERLRFLGSPSFQIDGMDLWAEERSNYALSCRVYTTPGGMRGAPDVEMLVDELRTFMKEHPDLASNNYHEI